MKEKQEGGPIMKNNLRVILATQRKTVAEIHEATGLSKYTLTQLFYERTKNPELQTLLKIANYLNVTVDELLGMKEMVI